jgi:proline iminopeptidase
MFTVGLLSNGWAQDGFIGQNPKIAYWKIGDQKPIVIVIHGGPAVQHQYLRPEFDTLTQQATVIYYDQRGVGKSDTATQYAWQDHVADLEKLIKALAKQQQVILAGSSWGSTLAMLYAYSHPQDVKGLILTGVSPWEGKGELYTPYQKLSHPKSVKGNIYESRIIRKPTENGSIKRDTVQITKELEYFRGSPQSETRISIKSAPSSDCLKQIRIPVLLFNGTHTAHWDWADHYAKLFPFVEWHTIEDAGHDPWLNNPTLFFSISNEFVRSNNR